MSARGARKSSLYHSGSTHKTREATGLKHNQEDVTMEPAGLSKRPRPVGEPVNVNSVTRRQTDSACIETTSDHDDNRKGLCRNPDSIWFDLNTWRYSLRKRRLLKDLFFHQWVAGRLW